MKPPFFKAIIFAALAAALAGCSHEDTATTPPAQSSVPKPLPPLAPGKASTGMTAAPQALPPAAK